MISEIILESLHTNVSSLIVMSFLRLFNQMNNNLKEKLNFLNSDDT